MVVHLNIICTLRSKVLMVTNIRIKLCILCIYVYVLFVLILMYFMYLFITTSC